MSQKSSPPNPDRPNEQASSAELKAAPSRREPPVQDNGKAVWAPAVEAPDASAVESETVEMTAARAAASAASGSRARGVAPSRVSLILVAILTGSALFMGGFTLGAHVATTPGTPADQEARFGPFWDVYSLIQSKYAGSPQPSQDQLVQAAINGMMQSLNDPWSYYQGPADFANSLLDVGGQAIGIGVQVQLQPVDPNATAACTAIGGRLRAGDQPADPRLARGSCRNSAWRRDRLRRRQVAGRPDHRSGDGADQGSRRARPSPWASTGTVRRSRSRSCATSTTGPKSRPGRWPTARSPTST